MLKILIVDDNPNKVNEILTSLESISVINENDIDTCVDLVTARRHLSEKSYDLLILDINIPDRYGKTPKSDGGIEFLYELNESITLLKPFHIIGITEFDELKEKYKNNFTDEIWLLIKYEQDYDHWKKQLINKVNYLVKSKKTILFSETDYNYDIAIITALRKPELEKILDLNAGWERFDIPNDPTHYHIGKFTGNNKVLKVVAASAPQMGMVPASTLSMKLIYNFRPKYLVMTGITAGVTGKGNFGDIIIAEQSWDSGSGKIKTKGDELIFHPDPKYLPLQTDLKEYFGSISSNDEFLDIIKKSWHGKKTDRILKAHLGPLASGASVIEHKDIMTKISDHNRKLTGVEMETYGVFYAADNCSKPRPIAISIKSICDFGDSEKNDDFQEYAAFTSAQYLYHCALDRF